MGHGACRPTPPGTPSSRLHQQHRDQSLQPTGFPIANPLQGTYGGGGSDALVSRIGNGADLILTKTASPEPVTTDDTVTYTLTIGNLSSDPRST